MSKRLKSAAHSSRALLRDGYKNTEAKQNPFPPAKIVFALPRPNCVLPRQLPEYLKGRTPKEKHPFLFQKKFHPRQIRNARSVFLSGLLAYSPVRGAFMERMV